MLSRSLIAARQAMQLRMSWQCLHKAEVESQRGKEKGGGLRHGGKATGPGGTPPGALGIGTDNKP